MGNFPQAACFVWLSFKADAVDAMIGRSVHFFRTDAQKLLKRMPVQNTEIRLVYNAAEISGHIAAAGFHIILNLLSITLFIQVIQRSRHKAVALEITVFIYKIHINAHFPEGLEVCQDGILI